MPSPILIQVKLEPIEIGETGQQIGKRLQSALDSGLGGIRSTGKKIGDALSSGAEEAIRRGEEKIRLVREQSAARQAAIAAKAAADQQRIQAKAYADMERDARRFAEAQEKALRRSVPPDSVLGFFKR